MVSLMDGSPLGPKTDKNNLRRYCQKTFEKARKGGKVVSPGVEPRVSIKNFGGV